MYETTNIFSCSASEKLKVGAVVSKPKYTMKETSPLALSYLDNLLNFGY